MENLVIQNPNILIHTLLYKDDGLHYSSRSIDGYNKVFNFIISERECGKSTAILVGKVLKSFLEDGRPSIILRRRKVNITQIYIDDLEKMMNKFLDNPIKFKYSKGNIQKDGMVDVYVDGKIFLRIVALCGNLSDLKSLMLPNLFAIVYDEFICNMALGEKYGQGEGFRLAELYRTFKRETSGIKCYFLGNPYSLYNPLFIFMGIKSTDIVRGKIISGSNWVLDVYEMKPELREHIIKTDPTYEFDNAYTRYAFDGMNVNDAHIPLIDEIPPNFKLMYVFRIEGKLIGLYQNQRYDKYFPFDFYSDFIEFDISKKRYVNVFDFKDLYENSRLVSLNDKQKFYRIKSAMRKRRIVFRNIECYYICEEIYYGL